MKRIYLIVVISLCASLVWGQDSVVPFKKTFEEEKSDGSTFKKIKVRVGADFALQFQSLKHHADSTLIPLGGNLNLPGANLTVEADLAPGIKVNLVTYLASRHHNDTWVKGGYLLIDEMPFFHSKLVDKVMKFITIKVGDCELNYGDDHFFRSDNGRVINNPFVGNFILDGFTTAPTAELYFRWKGILAMVAATSGNLNTSLGGYNSTTKSWNPNNLGKNLGYYIKLAWDKNISPKIRIRPAVSGYYCPNTSAGSLYAGDRAG
jgi:hypothetical protein